VVGILFTPTTIPEIVTLTPPRHADGRGFFTETFRAEWFPGIDFVQDNQSFSVERSTLRGLHYQDPPHDQAKLIQVPRGRIRDVAIDLRAGSPTFLQYVAVELSSDDGNQILIPTGFAHGFITLVPNTEVLYKVSGYYSREAERGIRWDDPALAIDWGITSEPILSERDRRHPPFDPATTPFRYGSK